jgi:uncharacterized membrane protein YjdF
VTRAQLVAGFDDFGHSLHGATPQTVADEVIAKRAGWDLVALAPKLASLPILSVSATYGLASRNETLTAALRKAGDSQVTAVEMDTDHSFSDHRTALSSVVVGWLAALRPVSP